MTIIILDTPVNLKAVLVTDDTMTVAEVADRLDVSARTVARWVNDSKRRFFPNAYKKNPALRNSHFVIPIEDVENFEQLREIPQSGGNKKAAS